MMRLATILAFGAAAAFVGSVASAQIGIPAKLKAGKVQGNLVPAYYPQSTGPGTGDDEGDSPSFQATAVQSSANCTFTQGKFKAQVGKDAKVALKGVTCSGTPFSGTLCAHTKILATIMNEDISKTGGTQAVTCMEGPISIQGTQNFVTGNIGMLTCTAGKCAGTLPVVTADPCPTVDKVTEIRRLEVFDGPDMASQSVLGTTLAVCCGPTQTLVGNIAPSGAPCNTSTQHVLAEEGNVTNVVAP